MTVASAVVRANMDSFGPCWTTVSPLFGSALGPLFLFLALVLLVGARLFLRVLAALLALSLVLTRFFLTT